MTSRLSFLIVALLLVTALTVACGGDGEPRSTTPVPAAPTTSFADDTAATMSPAPSPTASPESTTPATQTVEPTPTAPLPSPTAMPDVPLGESGNAEIYVMNADGTEQRRLTDQPSIDSSPAWSPDGSMLAFLSYSGYSGSLYVMNADGSNVRQLSDAATSRPVWSPDGRQILVVSGHGYEGGYPEIYVVAVDGSGQQRLTSFENVPTATLSMGNYDPAWSPDGTRIAFVAMQMDGPSEVHVMDADGTNVRRLTDSPGRKVKPVWSPDGGQIAFWTDAGDADIWVMRADGTGQRNLTNSPATDLNPIWSPDGQQIAFVSQIDSGNQIVLVNADGSDPRVIADGLGHVENLLWSPDGTQLAFAPFSEMGSAGIYVFSADGSDLRQVTDTAHADGEPAWSPDGTLIAFTSKRDGGQPIHCSWSSISDMAIVESVEALTWMSYVVVAGTIAEDIGPEFGGEGHRDMDGAWQIYSDYILDVERQFRGQPLETVRLRVEGGTIGGCTQTNEPSVALAEGMRVLVFLDAEREDADLPSGHFVSVVGTWTVAPDDTITSPSPMYNPPGTDGMTLDEIAALVAETLTGPPPPDAFHVVPIEESPATPQ